MNSINELWSELFPGEQTRLTRLLIENVIVLRDKLHINIKKQGIEAMLHELEDGCEVDLCHCGDDFITLTVPVKIKHSHGRKFIVSPELENPDNRISPLAKRLALAHKWNQMILTGEASSTKEIAERYDLQYSYVGHTLKMVNLTPELQRAILNGNEPESLNVANLRKAIPEDWREQVSLYF